MKLFLAILVSVSTLLASWAASLAPGLEGGRPEDDAAGRLRRVLWERTAPDGSRWGADALDPLLWDRTRGLLEGSWHAAARAALEDFLDQGPAAVPGDPLRRALLQRDLRAVFDWLAERAQREEDAGRALALAAPLARAIGRLALTPDELAGLPDTLEALASETGGGEHPSTSPALPADLLDPEGAWVRLDTLSSEPLARVHGAIMGGHSAFEVLVALPGGRERTRTWIDRLGRTAAIRDEDGLYRLPPGLGPPPGTRVALLRRALLLDTAGSLHVSGLVESLQMREFEPSGPASGDPGPEQQALRGQKALELRLDRQGLLAGGPGLRRLSPQRMELPTFMTHGIDPFELEAAPELDRWLQRPLERCGACHRGQGVDSLVSLTRFADETAPWRPPELIAVDARRGALRSLQQANADPALALLRRLMSGPR